MKILIITSRVPLPAESGYTIAVNNFVKGLYEANIDYTLLSINTSKHFVDTTKFDKIEYLKNRFFSAYIKTNINLCSAFFNLFSNKSYNIQRFISKQYILTITEILKNNQFDIIQIEGLYASTAINTIKKLSKAKIVFRAHNVEYLIWERMANSQTNIIKKYYFKLLADRLKKYEKDFILNKTDLLITFSINDLNEFINWGYENSFYINPIGIETKLYKTEKEKSKNLTLFYIASFDWMPNTEGLLWFAENVWENIQKKYPNLHFIVGGRYMNKEINDLKNKGIDILGEVKDAIQFITQNDIMIVPLLAGSGIRVKILEAMAAGKIVISTSIGAEGIQYSNLKNIIIADTPDEFLNAINKIIENNELFNLISSNAEKLIYEQYSNQKVINKLIEKYKEVVK
ncbi:MAG: hypothetical protein A2X12_05145 [Bacteroidetes bacterium GWE2_29_8]|nr:MAG: hypothetical protein A2X12_05145 [Bacteroidetes bacterium GWE2_29_8]OFY21707.1 MAG: hypothetical protein A2X02_04620 [Bacteroidetes bacterium GWF2_29_10]